MYTRRFIDYYVDKPSAAPSSAASHLFRLREGMMLPGEIRGASGCARGPADC